MQAEVNQELCISCGACIDMCPEVYDWNDDEKAHAIVHDVPDELEEQASEATESCPTDAIIIN
ncbi:MAG: ferredoxin [Firmicutes bacterium]|nr:ferredoxin [Bacillota bacterium]